jgi:hypothetical protein
VNALPVNQSEVIYEYKFVDLDVDTDAAMTCITSDLNRSNSKDFKTFSELLLP